MYKNRTHFFYKSLFVTTTLFFVLVTATNYGYGQTNTSSVASSGATISVGTREKNKIPITVIVSGADRVVISSYIGEGTANRALLGSASKVDNEHWKFVWDVTAVPLGTYRVFAVIIHGTSQTNSNTVSIDVGLIKNTTATTTTVKASSTIPLSPTSSTTPAISATSTGTTVQPLNSNPDVLTIPSNLETLSTIVNESTKNFEEKNTDVIQKTQDEINAITSTLPVSVATEKENIIEDITLAVIEVRKIVRDSILLGNEDSIVTIRKDFEIQINTQIKLLEDLASRSSLTIDSSSLKNSLLETVNTIIEETRQTEEAFKNRGGVLLYLDTDRDNVSDYDEKYIYKTDSEATDSDNDSISDGDEILAGTSPLSSINTQIVFADPNTSGGITTAFTVTNAEKAETKVIKGMNVATKILLKGRALPNSFVTLFIYSSPIVVTVKTNAEGDWQYILDKELGDGNHTVIVASVDTTGKILAKNSPSIFVKQADAVELLGPGSIGEAPSLFSNTSIILIVGVVVLLGALAVIYISYQHKKRGEEIKRLGGTTF